MEGRADRMQEALARRLSSVTLVAEATYLRHNLNAMVRTAEAFGLCDVHFISPLNAPGGVKRPKSSAARGAERWVDLHEHHITKHCLDKLKKQGFSIWVADLHEGAVAPSAVPVDAPVALVMGTELAGVSPEARSMADGFVAVPMHGLTRSLNVSVATACILQHLSERRRRLLGGGDLPLARQEELLRHWLRREGSGGPE